MYLLSSSLFVPASRRAALLAAVAAWRPGEDLSSLFASYGLQDPGPGGPVRGLASRGGQVSADIGELIEALSRHARGDVLLADAGGIVHRYRLRGGRARLDHPVWYEMDWWRVLSARQDFETSRFVVDQILRCAPDDELGLTWRSDVLARMGRTAEAVAEAERHLALRPASKAAKIALGDALLEHHRHGGGRQALERALAALAGVPSRDAFYTRACALAQLGRRDEAAALLEKHRRDLREEAGFGRDPDLRPLRGHPTFDALASDDPSLDDLFDPNLWHTKARAGLARLRWATLGTLRLGLSGSSEGAWAQDAHGKERIHLPLRGEWIARAIELHYHDQPAERGGLLLTPAAADAALFEGPPTEGRRWPRWQDDGRVALSQGALAVLSSAASRRWSPQKAPELGWPGGPLAGKNGVGAHLWSQEARVWTLRDRDGEVQAAVIDSGRL